VKTIQDKSTVKIAGFGGQGVVLASIILGRAALVDGRYATQTASYGSESRGGECKSEIVVSGSKIDYPLVDKVQTLVVMSQPALSKYIDDLLSGGTLLVDPDMVKEMPRRSDIEIVKVPATRTAEALGRRIVANMVMLGALQEKTRIVSKEALLQAVKENVPLKTVDLNAEAIEKGIRLVKN
jgi:2-oxoglutarate ferredoxin oxidoreductase subunit gamma